MTREDGIKWMRLLTPTLILPPQGGGDKKGVNPLFKGEEMRKELIHYSRGRR
jgi:hypothetical protein